MAASARVKDAFTDDAIRRAVGGLYRAVLSS
jgi:hypothetical protein